MMPESAKSADEWTLDPLEARVVALLRVRRGRAQAIRAGDLAGLAGIEGDRRRRASPRAVQTIIARLREQHGYPILSSAGKPPGYWWAATSDELEACIREQRRKAISTLVVLRALRRHRERLAGQTSMEMHHGDTEARRLGGGGEAVRPLPMGWGDWP